MVTVKSGYFRNFLSPRNLAQFGSKAVIATAEKRNEKRVLKKQQVVEGANEVLTKLKGLSVTVSGKVSEKGTLYASITEEHLVSAIAKAANVELDKGMIKMEHFKDLGEHKAIVHLGEGLEGEITVIVEAAE